MLTTFKATAKKLPDGLQVETESRGFKVLMDEPKNLGGTDVSLKAICAAAFARSQGIRLDDFFVELEGDLDPDGFQGKAPVRNGFQEIRFKMHMKTDAGQEEAEKFADFIESRCPVGDCLQNGVKLVRSGVVVE